MATSNTQDIRPLDKSFALAIAVLRERVRELPEEDRNDLCELTQILISADSEEDVESAVNAMNEIMDQAQVQLQEFVLPDSPDGLLAEWLTFFSGQLRDLRKEAGMTQEDLAKKSGLPQSHISRLENGMHSPSSTTIKKLAEAIGVSTASFDSPASP